MSHRSASGTVFLLFKICYTFNMNEELQNKKCAILGGVRGDDKLGVAVLTYYFKFPHDKFQLLLGNYQAIEKNVPFVDFDLLKAGKGDITCTTSVEKCRAGEIHEVLASFQYAVDVHGSHENDDMLVVFNTEPETIRFAKAFGVNKCVVVNPDNYLIESVPHAVTYIQKVAAKPQPETKEISKAIIIFNRLEKFFAGQELSVTEVKFYSFESLTDNALAELIDGKVGEERLKSVII